MTFVRVNTVATRTKQLTPEQMIAMAEVGDRVKFRVPAGIGRNGVEYKEKWGKVMIARHYPGHLALDCGGRFGTPGVATAANIVELRKARNKEAT